MEDRLTYVTFKEKNYCTSLFVNYTMYNLAMHLADVTWASNSRNLLNDFLQLRVGQQLWRQYIIIGTCTLHCANFWPACLQFSSLCNVTFQLFLSYIQNLIGFQTITIIIVYEFCSSSLWQISIIMIRTYFKLFDYCLRY